MTFTLQSRAFDNDHAIPEKYTCKGNDISPPLAWTGVPEGTRSLVLIVDDPDAPDPKAPKITWVHWVLYNLPPDATGLAEGIDRPSVTRGCAGRHQRLATHRLRGAVSAHRTSSLFPQTLRPGYDTGRTEPTDQDKGGGGDAGACPRPSRLGGNLPKITP